MARTILLAICLVAIIVGVTVGVTIGVTATNVSILTSLENNEPQLTEITSQKQISTQNKSLSNYIMALSKLCDITANSGCENDISMLMLHIDHSDMPNLDVPSSYNDQTCEGVYRLVTSLANSLYHLSPHTEFLTNEEYSELLVMGILAKNKSIANTEELFNVASNVVLTTNDFITFLEDSYNSNCIVS